MVSSMEPRRPLLVRADCLVGWVWGEGDRLRVDRGVDLASFAVALRLDTLDGAGAGFVADGFRVVVFGVPFDIGVVA